MLTPQNSRHCSCCSFGQNYVQYKFHFWLWNVKVHYEDEHWECNEDKKKSLFIITCKVQVFSEGYKNPTKSPNWFEFYYSKHQIKWEISSIFFTFLKNLTCTRESWRFWWHGVASSHCCSCAWLMEIKFIIDVVLSRQEKVTKKWHNIWRRTIKTRTFDGGNSSNFWIKGRWQHVQEHISCC